MLARDPRSSRSAFTLVELLVVIGIIALLISILLPTLSRARERANATKCLSNLRQLGMAMVQYTLDNRGSFPHTARGTGKGPAYFEDWVYWQQPNVLGDSTAFFWPKNTPANGGTRPADQSLGQSPIAKYLGKNLNNGLMVCPSDDPENRRGYNGPKSLRYPFSYTMNDMLSFRLNEYDPGAFAYFGGRPAKASNIRNAAEVVMLLEESPRTLNDGDSALIAIGGSSPNWNIYPGGQAAGQTMTGSADKPDGDWLSVAHDRKARKPDYHFDEAAGDKQGIPNSAAMGNVAFCDGHAEPVTREYVQGPIGRHWSWKLKQ